MSSTNPHMAIFNDSLSLEWSVNHGDRGLTLEKIMGNYLFMININPFGYYI